MKKLLILFSALVLLISAVGCSDDDPVSSGEEQNNTATTTWNETGGYWSTSVDGSDYDNFMYFSFTTKDTVTAGVTKPAATGWDIAFRREVIKLNGGTSTTNSGDLYGADLGVVDYASVTIDDTAGVTWVEDYIDYFIDEWYTYNSQTHQLTANQYVYSMLDATGTIIVNVTGPLPEPSSSAPTPTVNSADVISIYSDAYSSINIDTWSPDWDIADIEDFVIGSDSCKKYTYLTYAGIDFSSSTVDVSGMTHFHIDMWTPYETTVPTSFKVKIVDFGANGVYGGDDTEHEISFTESTIPAIASGTWVRVTSAVDFSFSYNYLYTRNLTTHEKLINRPDHTFKFFLTAYLEKWGVGGSFWGDHQTYKLWVPRSNTGGNEGDPEFAPHRTRLNMNVFKRFDNGLETFIRMENLLDETNLTYGYWPGFEIYAGIKYFINFNK